MQPDFYHGLLTPANRIGRIARL